MVACANIGSNPVAQRHTYLPPFRCNRHITAFPSILKAMTDTAILTNIRTPLREASGTTSHLFPQWQMLGTRRKWKSEKETRQQKQSTEEITKKECQKSLLGHRMSPRAQAKTALIGFLCCTWARYRAALSLHTLSNRCSRVLRVSFGRCSLLSMVVLSGEHAAIP